METSNLHSYDDIELIRLELERMISEGGAMAEGYSPYSRIIDGGNPPQNKQPDVEKKFDEPFK